MKGTAREHFSRASSSSPIDSRCSCWLISILSSSAHKNKTKYKHPQVLLGEEQTIDSYTEDQEVVAWLTKLRPARKKKSFLFSVLPNIHYLSSQYVNPKGIFFSFQSNSPTIAPARCLERVYGLQGSVWKASSQWFCWFKKTKFRKVNAARMWWKNTREADWCPGSELWASRWVSLRLWLHINLYIHVRKQPQAQERTTKKE